MRFCFSFVFCLRERMSGVVCGVEHASLPPVIAQKNNSSQNNKNNNNNNKNKIRQMCHSHSCWLFIAAPLPCTTSCCRPLCRRHAPLYFHKTCSKPLHKHVHLMSAPPHRSRHCQVVMWIRITVRPKTFKSQGAHRCRGPSGNDTGP